jgi:hypothetical protein
MEMVDGVMQPSMSAWPRRLRRLLGVALACTSCADGSYQERREAPRTDPMPPDPITQSVVPDPVPRCDNGFLSWDDVYSVVERELLERPAEDRRFIRFVTLTNRYDAGACEAELEQARSSLNEIFNSISRAPDIRTAMPLDDALGSRTIYALDLRLYALDVGSGPFIVDGAPHEDAWDAIADQSSFVVELQGAKAENASLQTGTTVPVMFLDAMIGALSNPVLYSGLLQLPSSRTALLASLGVDPSAGFDVLARLPASEHVSRDRVVMRSSLPAAGYYYERFELDPREPGTGVLEDPLGFMLGASLGDMALFSLPNGLQAYTLFDASGSRLDELSVVFDARDLDPSLVLDDGDGPCVGLGPCPDAFEPGEEEQLVLAGVSCVGCHASGLVALAAYPPDEALLQTLATDGIRYRAALASSGVPDGARDAVWDVRLLFERDVALRAFAGDLLYPELELFDAIPRLDPALSGLDNGFAIDRGDIAGLFVHSLCTLYHDSELRPTRQACDDAGFID